MSEPVRKIPKKDAPTTSTKIEGSEGYTVKYCASGNNLQASLVFELYTDTIFFTSIDFTDLNKSNVLYRTALAVKDHCEENNKALPYELRFGSQADPRFKSKGELERLVQTVCSRTQLILWDPKRLHDKDWKPKCPTCTHANCVYWGWAVDVKKLIGDGEEDVWVFTSAAKCKTCPTNKHFQLCDPEVVAQLPAYVQLKLPGVLTRQCGLTWRVLRTLSIMPPQGTSFSGICDMVNEKAHMVHKMLELEYLTHKRTCTMHDFMPCRSPAPAGAGTASNSTGGGSAAEGAVSNGGGSLGGSASGSAGGDAGSSVSGSVSGSASGSVAAGQRAGGSSGGTAAGGPSSGAAFNGKKVLQFPRFEDGLYGGERLSVQYAVKCFLAAVCGEVEAAEQHMRSLPFEVLRIDGAFKNAKKVRTVDGERAFKESTTAMNERGEIVGVYLGGGGLLELEDALRRLALRNLSLGKCELAMIYVDNSHTTGKLLERCFPGMPLGGGVKEDLFHVERRLTDTLPADHALRATFISELAGAFRVRRKEDEALAASKGWPITDTTCRSEVPPPAELLKRFDRVITRYERQVDASTGARLLNADSLDAIERIRAHIKEGRLSDPVEVEMYTNVEPDPEKPPKWRSKRGTSALEGFHRHWHELLPGFNTSPELADTLMMLFLGRWNRKKSFQYGAAFYGTFNYQLLCLVNRAYVKLGLPIPYPDAEVPKPIVEERMLSSWSELTPLPGLGGGPAAAAAPPGPIFQLVKAAHYGAASELALLLEANASSSWAAPLMQVLEQAVGTGDRMAVRNAAIMQFAGHGWWLPSDIQLPHVRQGTDVTRGTCIERLPQQLTLGDQTHVCLGRPQVMNGSTVPVSPAVEAVAAAALALRMCAAARSPAAVDGSRSPPPPLLQPRVHPNLAPPLSGMPQSLDTTGAGGVGLGGGGAGGGVAWLESVGLGLQPGTAPLDASTAAASVAAPASAAAACTAVAAHTAAAAGSTASAATGAASAASIDRRMPLTSGWSPPPPLLQPRVHPNLAPPLSGMPHSLDTTGAGGVGLGGGGAGGGVAWLESVGLGLQPGTAPLDASTAAASVAAPASAAATQPLPLLGHMPLHSLQPVAAGGDRTQAVSKGPNRLKAYLKRGRSGSSRRLTVADTMRSVATSEEMALYWELYPAYTKGVVTDWTGMTREWNVRVLTSTRTAPDKAFANIYPKRENHLRAYEKEACRLISARDSLALMQRVGLQPHFAPSAQAAVAAAMANVFSAPLAVLPTNQAAGGAAVRQAGESPSRQGGGDEEEEEDEDEEKGQEEHGDNKSKDDGDQAGAAASGWGFLRSQRDDGKVKINKGSRARGTQLQGKAGCGKGGKAVFKGCKKCGFYTGKPKSECLAKDGHRAKCPYKDKADPPRGWKWTVF